MRECRLGPWFSMLFVSTFLAAAFAGDDGTVRSPSPPASRASVEGFDHSAFDGLLQRYVDDQGLVAYARWKASPADLVALDEYLERLAQTDLGAKANREAWIAFWVNAYNALTLHGVLQEYPTSSIRNHTAFFGYNIWTDLKLHFDDRAYSLDQMEHEVLKKTGEPLVHFGLVCASRGCPPLRNRAYAAEGIGDQLAENGRRFLARNGNLRSDFNTNTIYMSELFKWHGADFAPTPAGQLKAIATLLPTEAQWATAGEPRVLYLDYDWLLNDQSPAVK